jgi:hypothetical protein
MVGSFVKRIVDFLSFIYANENADDMSLLCSITGTIDEAQGNYCLKKLKNVCQEAFCIANLVEEFNEGFETNSEADSE